MTAFELQVDPERNAIIRRALAKRIVQQREEEEEEASTEEDESFLGNSIAIVRSETQPELLKKGGDTEDNNNITSNQDTPATQPTLEDTISAAPVEPQVEEITMEEPLPTATAATAMDISVETQPEHNPTFSAAEEGAAVEKEPEIDPIEQDILLQLEELKKEKSRLFALFRSTLQKNEQEPPSAPPATTAALSASHHNCHSHHHHHYHNHPNYLSYLNYLNYLNYPNYLNYLSFLNHRKYRSHHRLRKRAATKIHHPREHERIIDRSKLNLEIPRKPTLSNSSSNSTSSTPTNSFASPPSSAGATMMKPKRQRSISPIAEDGPLNSSNNYRGSGAGSFGPIYSSSSSYGESSVSNKYPRADLSGFNANRHGGGGGGSGSNNSHNINGLPEKPQVRHHHHSGPSSSSSSARGLGADSYHGDDGYHRGKGGNGPSSLMSPGMNGSGGNGGGSYRQQGGGSLGYHHSQGPPPPPTRIGFGNSNSNSGSSNINTGGGNSGGSGNGTGSNAVGAGNSGRGAGGYYGHNDGPPPPISMLGPPGGRPLSFNRHMMQMPHARGGMLRNRPGFAGAGGSGGGSGRGNGGGGGGSGPPDRPMSSGRPGEWSRRRSRA
ncbi:hypothetical protein KI688_010746 [Linnemannia hyalina]|uniref:Uncharacterized protein n=1 Tax=Linnemannia hyalina TaxID=64524 RepID=A0A9P7XZE6_9FUNG|nr:hypothetical protein KI688_010746 [Linnemannia hyalina]